ncbi:MAG: NADH-quinone oxidoreductase subunit NuoE [Proteobacteria bacterium]|nr:NADH-quinone oxidoreductase subunit NuoE [Pseudomonadota bacterium]
MSSTSAKILSEKQDFRTVVIIAGNGTIETFGGVCIVEKGFDELLQHWKGQKGNVIPLLQKTQELRGYLDREDMTAIAEATGKSPADIYGVATFYSQFRFQSAGKHTLKVCHGTACHVNGAERLDLALKTELGIEPGQTTEDGQFSVEKVACLGCCSLAPVVMLDQEVHGRLTGDKLKKIVRRAGQ